MLNGRSKINFELLKQTLISAAKLGIIRDCLKFKCYKKYRNYKCMVTTTVIVGYAKILLSYYST